MTEPTGTGPTDEGQGAKPEVEATLAVTSETPAEVAERLAELDGVGPYRFEWHGADELRDLYLDTPSGELRALGLALRLRRTDDGWRITLKGPARPASGGAVKRSELELEWSPAGFRRVLEELRGSGVELPDAPSQHSGSSPADPVEALGDAGFVVIQDRRTRRRRARVPAEGAGGGGTLAWLVVDTVHFRDASGRAVRHREVEIEATASAPEGLPGDVAGQLRRRFGDSLRPWEHPKLATGAALAEIEPPVGPDGDLRPGAYDRLERELSGDGGDEN